MHRYRSIDTTKESTSARGRPSAVLMSSGDAETVSGLSGGLPQFPVRTAMGEPMCWIGINSPRVVTKGVTRLEAPAIPNETPRAVVDLFLADGARASPGDGHVLPGA